MPLIIAPENKELTIIKILAEDKIKKHLESLGIVVNSKITILNQSGGNVMCKVCEGKIALERNLATKSIVA